MDHSNLLNEPAAPPRINAYCTSRGWLFDDLKRQIAEHGALISNAPLLLSFEVLMIGYGLDSIERLGRWERRAAAPSDYARISAFMTLNKSEMVALSAYEACAAGRAVITTPRGWPHPNAPTVTEITQPVHWPMVYTAETVEGLAEHVVEHVERPQLFEAIRPYGREDWIEHQMEEARRLCSVPH